MRTPTTVLVLLLLAAPATAGLHYSGETFAPLPVKWRGFLLDHRALRGVAAERGGSPLRAEYAAARDGLERLAAKRPLTADEAADLGALRVRLGEPGKAVDGLRSAARAHPNHFRLAANLGTAWQLAGDLEQAAVALEDAVRLAPPPLRDAERLHLKLVRLRLKEGKAPATAVDDLFGVRFVGENGKPAAGALAAAGAKKLPADAVALLQRLALSLPADGRLLWHLGELANAAGDVRTAAAVLDGCVTEFALGAPDLRARRTLYRAAVDELNAKPDRDPHRGTGNAKSARALVRPFDESKLPPVRADAANPLPWDALAATTLDRTARPTFLKHLDALDGKAVTLTGFMRPARDELEFTGFLLVEYPVGCWFCEAPDATGLVNVELKPGRTAELKKGLVRIDGTLRLNRDDPEAFLFTVADARVGEAE